MKLENNNKFHHTVLTESLYNKALEEIKNCNEIYKKPNREIFKTNNFKKNWRNWTKKTF